MRLAVTRDEAALADLRSLAEPRQIEILSLEFLKIETLPFELPDEFDWLVLTSANGARSFLDYLRRSSGSLPTGCKIAAIGRKAAAVLEDGGISVDFLPSESTGETLFNELIKKHLRRGETLLFARAEKVSFDPADLMAAHGISYHPVVCYRSIIKHVSGDAINKLQADDHILFTAPSTVRAYHDQFGAPLAHPIAMGPITAAQMRDLNWENIEELKSAEIETVLELI